ncbi:MAG: hypothetical protein MUC78_11795 [Bacteroidales bacterium]|nr:hypothetical protein [Bacteroidales bacterium]
MARKYPIMFLLAFSALFTVKAEIKDIGTPYIHNFSKLDYRAGTQNWAITQDLRGFIYIGNNDGLLVYDGVEWKLNRMPNLSMVRSVYIDNEGEVFIGANNEMGRMVTSENGQMTYSSLRDQIPEEYRNFDDVWNIFPYGGSIVFQSYYTAFIYKEGTQVSVLTAPYRFKSSYNVDGRLIFNDEIFGLMEYDGENLKPLAGCTELIGQEIGSILPFNNSDEILICTRGIGLFIHDGTTIREWDVKVNEMLKTNQIYSATRLHETYFAIGTILDGLMIIDESGSIVQHINKKKGLQNNTILSLYPDRAGNLWLGLDNGIDYVIINSPITFIQDPEGFGAGYTSVIFNGRLYLGTNQGLYVQLWDEGPSGNSFYMIPGTDGQVWYLGVHRGALICGHDKGTYIINGESARLINDIEGGWKYHELKSYPGYMIGGTYSGIIIFRWEEGTWRFIRKIEGFNESFRVFEEDYNGDIWMSHGFKGIFRVRLSEKLDSIKSVRFYGESDGLPSNFYLNVFKIRDKIIFTSEQGIYEYVPAEDRFTYSQYFNKLLTPLVSVSYLKEDKTGNIWYVADNRTGVFRIQEDLSVQYVTSPFTLLSGRFIHGFESVYPYNEEHLLIAIENGFAHYSPHAYFRRYQEFSTYITKGVEGKSDSIFYYGESKRSDARKRYFTFPYRNNSLSFTFTSPVYDDPDNIEYSYMLAGLDKDWSAWGRATLKEYANLSDGKYEFMVKAKNQLGVESIPDSVVFVIQSPWYKSVAAYFAYLIMFISALLLLAWTTNMRIEASGRRERLNNLRVYRAKEQEYIRQALESEKELIRIRSEKLQAEMILRDKELANQAMNLVRKNEFLLKMKDELQNLKRNCQDETVSDRILQIINRLNREVDSNKQREIFELAFDEVHEDFLNRLKSRYPTLTPTELRLCAFLKMNISTKEIAPLMNISIRGVEICRYRVRKKMGITRDTNLTGMLLNL